MYQRNVFISATYVIKATWLDILKLKIDNQLKRIIINLSRSYLIFEPIFYGWAVAIINIFVNFVELSQNGSISLMCKPLTEVLVKNKLTSHRVGPIIMLFLYRLHCFNYMLYPCKAYVSTFFPLLAIFDPGITVTLWFRCDFGTYFSQNIVVIFYPSKHETLYIYTGYCVAGTFLSEVEHATSRPRRLPTILNLHKGAREKKLTFCFFRKG